MVKFVFKTFLLNYVSCASYVLAKLLIYDCKSHGTVAQMLQSHCLFNVQDTDSKAGVRHATF